VDLPEHAASAFLVAWGAEPRSFSFRKARAGDLAWLQTLPEFAVEAVTPGKRAGIPTRASRHRESDRSDPAPARPGWPMIYFVFAFFGRRQGTRPCDRSAPAEHAVEVSAWFRRCSLGVIVWKQSIS